MQKIKEAGQPCPACGENTIGVQPVITHPARLFVCDKCACRFDGSFFYQPSRQNTCPNGHTDFEKARDGCPIGWRVCKTCQKNARVEWIAYLRTLYQKPQAWDDSWQQMENDWREAHPDGEPEHPPSLTNQNFDLQPVRDLSLRAKLEREQAQRELEQVEKTGQLRLNL